MKKQDGITLVSLVMTVIITLILTGVVAYIGLESFENMRVEAYIAKMKTVQEGVDKFCQKYSVAEINEMSDLLSGVSASVPEVARNTLDEVITDHLRNKRC